MNNVLQSLKELEALHKDCEPLRGSRAATPGRFQSVGLTGRILGLAQPQMRCLGAVERRVEGECLSGGRVGVWSRRRVCVRRRSLAMGMSSSTLPNITSRAGRRHWAWRASVASWKVRLGGHFDEFCNTTWLRVTGEFAVSRIEISDQTREDGWCNRQPLARQPTHCMLDNPNPITTTNIHLTHPTVLALFHLSSAKPTKHNRHHHKNSWCWVRLANWPTLGTAQTRSTARNRLLRDRGRCRTYIDGRLFLSRPNAEHTQASSPACRRRLALQCRDWLRA